MATTSTSGTIANSTVSPATSFNASSSPSEAEDGSGGWEDASAPRITFLSVFIGFGFIGNLLLVITICHSRRFRNVAFFIFASNLAIVNICECALNMTVLLSVTLSNSWTFGNVACKVSAFFLHLICVETILALTVLTTDRLIAVRFKEKYDHVISTPRISILLLYTWFQSVAFSVPVAAGTIPTSANVYIKHCSIAEGGSIAFGIISTLACVIVPLILIITFFVKIIRTGYKDRMLIRSLVSQHNYNDDSQPEPRIKTELRYTNLTGTLCVAWLVMCGPYVVTLYFNMLQNSSELDDVTGDHVTYVWYVDMVLLWLRFSFTLVLPIAAFTWNKELWKSFKDMVLCRKNNAIVDESFKKNESDTQRLERKIKEEQNREKEKEAAVNAARDQSRVFHVPVLFATSHGVHIRTETDDSDSETSDSKHGGTLRGKKCDVLGSLDNLNALEDDTSDYDSGTDMDDPFSASHPISVRHIIQGSDSTLSDQHRSSSHPEVRRAASDKDRKQSVTLGSSSAGDSGLDLSTGVNGSALRSPLHGVERRTNVQDKEIVVHRNSNDSGTYTDGLSEKHEKDGVKCESTKNECVQVDRETPSRTANLHEKQPEASLGCVVSKSVQNDYTNNYVENLKQNSEAIFSESRATKRRKKKRRDKHVDEKTSQGTASPLMPLRPPPRLAPITNNTKQSYSGPGRPGSTCSSQYSALDNYSVDNTQTVSCGSGPSTGSYPDFAKADLASLDNLSLASFTTRRSFASPLRYNSSTESAVENDPLHLDCDREIKSVPEEVLTPSACHVTENAGLVPCCDKNTKQASDETDASSGIGMVENQPPASGKNSESRKKRRDMIGPSSLLNDAKGYTRLQTDK